jgi:uncharacterized protein (DUF433 family)
MADAIPSPSIPGGKSTLPAGPIETDLSILGGKPHIRGTRLGVEYLQGLLATGWSREAIQEVYPYVPAADLDQALDYKS